MPDFNLYVMELDQSQLDQGEETIQKVMEGKEKWLISTRTSSMWMMDKTEYACLIEESYRQGGTSYYLHFSSQRMFKLSEERFLNF